MELGRLIRNVSNDARDAQPYVMTWNKPDGTKTLQQGDF
jgi:hypothetical protein